MHSIYHNYTVRYATQDPFIYEAYHISVHSLKERGIFMKLDT